MICLNNLSSRTLRATDVKLKLLLNDMILIKDDDITTRNKWKKSVIDQLIKGSEGEVRNATLRVCTKDGKMNLIKEILKD